MNTPGIAEFQHCDRSSSNTVSNIFFIILVFRTMHFFLLSIFNLSSPLTYEALLDESHGIKCGQVELPAPPGGSQQPDPKLVKVSLNSSDKTFVKIRNKTMGPEIFDTLSGLAKHLKMLQSKMTGGAASVAEMKELVQKNLKDAQSNQALPVRVPWHNSISEDLIYLSRHVPFNQFAHERSRRHNGGERTTLC